MGLGFVDRYLRSVWRAGSNTLIVVLHAWLPRNNSVSHVYRALVKSPDVVRDGQNVEGTP